MEEGFRGRFPVVWFPADSRHERSEERAESRSHPGDEGKGPEGDRDCGPRGSCDSSLDLVRLAHVDVEPKDTVPMLQQKIRPTVALMMEKRPASAAAKPMAADKVSFTSISKRGGRIHKICMVMVSSPEKDYLETRLKELFAEQDQRVMDMMNQVMQHVMSVQQVPSDAILPGEGDEASATCYFCGQAQVSRDSHG